MKIPTSEQLDIERAAIRGLGVTIGAYCKSVQGVGMIEAQEPFVLNGKIYQGYNLRPVEASEDQLSDREIESLHDVDGTKHLITQKRNERLAGSRYMKDKEFAERKKVKNAQDRDELELRKLQREEAEYLASKGEDAPIVTKGAGEPVPGTARVK